MLDMVCEKGTYRDMGGGGDFHKMWHPYDTALKRIIRNYLLVR